MKYRTTILLNGKTATGIEVPPAILSELGSSKKPAVLVTLNGYAYRSTVATVDGKYMIPVSADVRKGAGVAAGDEVEVELALDTAPREVTLPADFAAALEGDATAKQTFEKLSYSHKRAHVQPIEDAKTPETRQRRIASTLSKLHEGKG